MPRLTLFFICLLASLLQACVAPNEQPPSAANKQHHASSSTVSAAHAADTKAAADGQHATSTTPVPLSAQKFLASLPASFSGTLQCQYCPLVKTRVLLMADGAFFFRQKLTDAHGQPFTQDDIGHWTFDTKTRLLSLFGRREQPLLLNVDAQGQLTPSDARAQGGLLTGQLVRDEALQPFAPHSYMKVLYDSGADTVKECRTGRDYSLADAHSITELAELDPAAVKPHRLLIGLEGTLTPAGVEVAQWQLANVNIIKARPGENCDSEQQDAELKGTYWRLILLGNKVVEPASGAQQPNIIFKHNGELAGQVGCARLSGRYIHEQQDMRIGELQWQVGSCADPHGQQQRLIEALQRTTHFRVAGQTLELMGLNNNALAHFEAAYLK